jgi:hypothetical protein
LIYTLLPLKNNGQASFISILLALELAVETFVAAVKTALPLAQFQLGQALYR